MYASTLGTVAEVAAKKVAYLRKNPLGYLISAMLAGAYVGVGVFLVFAIGGPMKEAGSPWMKIMMGGSFAVALSLVIFAGAELFTGNNMTLAVGWWRGTNSFGQLLAIWGASWFGNLLGAVLLAIMLFYSSALNGRETASLIQAIAEKKMHHTILELFFCGILCNWLVCLGVWCSYRMQSEIGKLVMIFWCLYAFVATGFEHSVANMTLLTLALLQPHTAAVTCAGMGYNLLWVSLGNAVGGALFVGGAYWLAGHTDTPATAPRVPTAAS